MKGLRFLIVFLLLGMMSFSAYTQSDTSQNTVTIPSLEYAVLKKALSDLAVVETDLGIANQKIENLLSRLDDYKEKEQNWQGQQVAWTNERAVWVREKTSLEGIIKDQNRQIIKGKITSWTAPIGVTLVATAILVPILISK